MFLKKYKFAIPALVIFALLAALATHSIFSAYPAKAFAHLTVEVNPEITMTVDSNEKVVAVELKNEEARQVFAEHTLVGKLIDDALKLVTDRLDKSGFLNDDNKVFFILQPAEGVKKEALAGVSERILVTLRTELETRKTQPAFEIVLLDSQRQNTQAPVSKDDDNTNTDALSDTAVKTASVTEAININDPTTWNHNIRDSFKDMLTAGLKEADALDILKNALLVNPESREIYEIASGFVDMKDVGIPYLVSKNIFEIGQELDQNLFRKEISTLISDLIDMHEVGISNETGLKALAMAIGADRSLKEVSTIISGIIDLKESGVSESELLTRTLRAIEADPTLRNFDDLLGIKDDYDDYNDDNDSDDNDNDENDRDDISKDDDKQDDDSDDDYDDYADNDDNYGDDSESDSSDDLDDDR